MDEAIKEKALKDLRRDYPDMPISWLEMAYDFITKHPERAERIINGEEEVPQPKDRSNVRYACVEYKNEEEMKRLESIGKMECVVNGTGN